MSALTAPTLTAAAAGASAVELSWTAVAGATGYDLDQWDGSAWVLLERNLSGTSYTHSGLAARTTYYYQVRALGAGGAEGPWSDLKQATTGPGGATPTTTPTPVSALTAPTLTAAAAGASAVELSWTAVAGATGYDLDQWDGSAWVLLERNLSGTSYTHSGLAARTTYYYQVRALGAGGAEGPWSDWKEATTDPRGTTTPTFTPTPTPSGDQTSPATDRAALAALYNAAGGANWANNTNWLSARPLDEWHGVTTDSNGRVTELSLYDNQLSGTIPAELGNLSSLTGLNLGYNQLSGTIPSELGNLSSLTGLYLYDNQLSGTIPSELGNLSSLTGLNLGSNQLSGTIPSELGNLSSLIYLNLSSNQLRRNDPVRTGQPLQPDISVSPRQPVERMRPRRLAQCNAKRSGQAGPALLRRTDPHAHANARVCADSADADCHGCWRERSGTELDGGGWRNGLRPGSMGRFRLGAAGEEPEWDELHA